MTTNCLNPSVSITGRANDSSVKAVWGWLNSGNSIPEPGVLVITLSGTKQSETVEILKDCINAQQPSVHVRSFRSSSGDSIAFLKSAVDYAAYKYGRLVLIFPRIGCAPIHDRLHQHQLAVDTDNLDLEEIMHEFEQIFNGGKDKKI